MRIGARGIGEFSNRRAGGFEVGAEAEANQFAGRLPGGGRRVRFRHASSVSEPAMFDRREHSNGFKGSVGRSKSGGRAGAGEDDDRRGAAEREGERKKPK